MRVGNNSTRNAAIGPYTIVTNNTITVINPIIFHLVLSFTITCFTGAEVVVLLSVVVVFTWLPSWYICTMERDFSSALPGVTLRSILSLTIVLLSTLAIVYSC